MMDKQSFSLLQVGHYSLNHTVTDQLAQRLQLPSG